MPSKEGYLSFRIDPRDREAFLKACQRSGYTPSRILRACCQAWVKDMARPKPAVSTRRAKGDS